MGTVAIICIAAVLVAICIVLAIIIYHQMLLYNEVNKRLLLIAKESIDKERSTQEELNQALQELERMSNEQASPEPAEIEQDFNPHTYHDSDLN